MAFEDYKQKSSVVIVYTGESKGKTSASIGLMARALGTGWRVAFIQFIKHWNVGEHDFIRQIQPLYNEKLYFYKGGMGFFNAGSISARNVTAAEHKKAARTTYRQALELAGNGEYDLVICDEINNAVHDGLLSETQLHKLLLSKHPNTSLCLTGRNYPDHLYGLVDIATNMSKIKHHFDDKFLANPGIDY